MSHCTHTTSNSYSRRGSGILGLVFFGLFFFAIFNFGILGGSLNIAGFPIPTIFMFLIIMGIVRSARRRPYRNRRMYSQRPPVYSAPRQPSTDYETSFSSQPKTQKSRSSYCPSCGTELGIILQENQSIYCSHCGEHISK